MSLSGKRRSKADKIAAYRASKPQIAPGIRELKRAAINPIVVAPGDTIQLTYRETDDETGQVVTERVVLEDTITKSAVFTEGVIFDAEEGIFGKGSALGGAFVEDKK